MVIRLPKEYQQGDLLCIEITGRGADRCEIPTGWAVEERTPTTLTLYREATGDEGGFVHMHIAGDLDWRCSAFH